jgi:hypothetical protein
MNTVIRILYPRIRDETHPNSQGPSEGPSDGGRHRACDRPASEAPRRATDVGESESVTCLLPVLNQKLPWSKAKAVVPLIAKLCTSFL